MALGKYAHIKKNNRTAGTSRYSNCDLVITEDAVRLSFVRKRSGLDTISLYKTGQVPHARTSRPDLMAYVAYGNPALYWVLYYFNRVLCQGPFRFHQGDIIVLPHPTSIAKWMNTQGI